MSGKPIVEAVAMLAALQERWCASTAGKPGSRRIATFDPARGARGEDDFDNEVAATRRCAGDLGLVIERITALTAAQQQGQACTCPSGDGSLRWPCPAHPPTQQGGGETIAGKFDRRVLNPMRVADHRTAPPSAPVGVEGFDAWWDSKRIDSEFPDMMDDRTLAKAAWDAALAQQPAAVYQCPRCATSMEVDPTAKPVAGAVDDVEGRQHG